ncbi:hypothetical protein Q7689_27390 [Nocardiopsis tropica]|uniref:hypothetical protein n=1 Tax=Nocardiopsis tropica TaxID=109330 RepID=UPI002E85D461|nr:hypothetical protein [Nocardiopsis tropica]
MVRNTVRMTPRLRRTLWALRWLIALVVHWVVLFALLMAFMTAFPQLHYGTMMLTTAVQIVYAPVQLLGLVIPLCALGGRLADTHGGGRVGWSLLLTVVPLLLAAVLLGLLAHPGWAVYIMYFATGLLLSTTAVYSALPRHPEKRVRQDASGTDSPAPEGVGKP